MNRRRSLQTMLALGAAAAAAHCAKLVPQDVGIGIAPNRLTDAAVLNFALNLEYLEAEYYRLAVSGENLPAADIGPKPGGVVGGRRVSFATPAIRELAMEIAEDELAHVRYIRKEILGDLLVVPSRPSINFRDAFQAVGVSAGLGSSFDPFADEVSFLLGAFVFEDVGVTAYTGAAKLISEDQKLESAAGILAVEGYHAGAIRTELYLMGAETRRSANAISAARDALNGTTSKDQGITSAAAPNAGANVVPSDRNAIAFPRHPEEVLRIVYLTPKDNVSEGGFFPEGVNGVVDVT
ncbi:MAG TPA: ferritin-like domain-containing protein [Vicinamibacterales bacterium]|nr:ferritin-like domain-containing protein [Vicinamibacterales bacterium]